MVELPLTLHTFPRFIVISLLRRSSKMNNLEISISPFRRRSLNGSNPVKIEAEPSENSHHNVSSLIKREQTTEHLDCDRDYEQTSGIAGDVRAEDLSMPDHVSSHIMDS